MKPNVFNIEMAILSNRHNKMDFIKHIHQLLKEHTFTVKQQHVLLNVLRSRVMFSNYGYGTLWMNNLHDFEKKQVEEVINKTDTWNRAWFDQIHNGQKYFGNDEYMRSMSVIMS